MGITYSINNGVVASNRRNANLWRTTPDTDNTFADMIFTAMVNNNRSRVAPGIPGAWNDADMLEVGNFFEDPQPDATGRTNFALWCLMKAPLILGTDLTNLTQATLKTITTKGAIAVSKDSLGEQGVLRESPCYNPPSPYKPHYTSERPRPGSPCGHQVWSGALSQGKVVAALVNLGNRTTLQITLTTALLPPTRQTPGGIWDIVDIYADLVVCKSCSLPRSVVVSPHDVAFWILAPSE